MKKFNKIILSVLLLSVVCLFTSCIDYVQTISFVDGQYISTYKVTMSKLLMEQTDSEDSFYMDIEDIEDSLAEMGCEYAVQNIDNDFDAGYEFALAVDEDDTDYDFMPYLYHSELHIPFLLGQDSDEFEDILNDDDDEIQAITLMMLSSGKARVIIDKDIMPDIRGAYFAGYDSDCDLPVYDYGDSFGVEIPLTVLALGSDYDLEYLIVY